MTQQQNVLIYEFWKNSSPNEARNTIQFLLKQENLLEYLEILLNVDELCEYFCSYCWILKAEPEVGLLINRPEVPTALLYKLIYFGIGTYFEKGHSDLEVYFSTWTRHIKSEQSFRLLRDEPLVEKDISLKIHLLANFDAKKWETYFNSLYEKVNGINEVLEIFKNMDSTARNSLFYKNPTLFRSLRNILILNKGKSDQGDDFLGSLKVSLDRIHEWQRYAKMIHTNFNPADDKAKPPRLRNADRIASVIHKCLEFPDSDRTDFLDYLLINNVIVDDSEFEMLSSLVKNFTKNKNLFFN